jgi:hypothetical protein
MQEEVVLLPEVQAVVQLVGAGVQAGMQSVVKLVVQLYTILVRKEKEEVVVQGQQSFQLLVGKANDSF